jgi:glycosyltransferase involved in cell wall biosynthesis
MIKVLRIINRFNLGGPTYNATFLSRYLPDEFETLLVGGVPDEGETDSLHILEKYGVTPVIIPELQRDPNFISDRKAYRKLRQIIREFKPDIVHTHASKAGLLGRKAAHAEGVKIIVHTFHGHVFHSYFGALKTGLIKRIERNLAKKTTGIVAISELQKRELVEIHAIAPEDKFKVIPLGFDLSEFTQDNTDVRRIVRNKFGVREDEVAVAIVGRLAPIKNHLFFLDVIEALLKTEQNIKVFIVGDGSERETISQRVNELNSVFDNRITMTSWILDIAAFNKGMDIICLTSNNEGTPVSLIEAQASGLPVISTDVGGVHDVVMDGKSGFVIKKGDFETYVEKLRLLVRDKLLRRKFAETGRAVVVEKYGYQRLVDDMIAFYTELIERNE